MNIHALNTLEYYKIKENLRNFAISSYGQKLVDALEPSDHLEKIQNQIHETTEAKKILEKTSSIPLQTLVGVENVMMKLGKGVVLLTEDLSAICQLLKSTNRLKRFMEEHASLAPSISQYAYSMYALDDVSSEIERCIVNGRIDDRASQTLEKIRKKIYIAQGRIKSKLTSIVQSSSLRPYLQDTNISIKNDHYVVSVKSEYKKEVPGVVIDKSTTGSTLFIEPEAIGRLQQELDLLKVDEEKEEYQIRMYLTTMVESCSREIQINIETLGYYDFIFAKGKLSRSMDANPVTVHMNGITKIINGRHPLLPSNCVPLNFEIGDSYRGLVITGPNTGGKTVALKTVGLFSLMAQSGMHVSADTGSCFNIYSDILVDIGDGQSIEQSLSTFSSHIKNIIEIMKCATKYTLVILDEVGSGTDPTEGQGLAIAILDELFEKGSTILATSHFSEVKTYASQKEGFINGRMTFDIQTLKPLYRLQIGEAGESNGLIIALRLGMSQKVVEKAHEVTYHEHKDYTPLLQEQMRLAKSNMVRNDNLDIVDSNVSNDFIHNADSNTTSYQGYVKKSKPRSIQKDATPVYAKEQNFNIGDVVYIHTVRQRGTVYCGKNKKDEYGVIVNDKKMFVHEKRLSLFIDKKYLYPDNYDFDIVFKSKEYRKKNKIMNKRHVEGLEIEFKEDEL